MGESLVFTWGVRDRSLQHIGIEDPCIEKVRFIKTSKVRVDKFVTGFHRKLKDG